MLEEMLKQALIVAKIYKRNNRWADLEDMTQEAMTAVVAAAPSYDPMRSSAATFGNKVAYRALGDWLIRNRGVIWNERLAKETMRCTYTSTDALERRGTDAVPADDFLCEERALKSVSERVAVLMASDKEAQMACEVMLGTKSAAVAQAANVPVQTVYKATARMKEQMRTDTVLRDAWDAL
jgi:RNA polymerase sigma factor (sigma-70 family)